MVLYIKQNEIIYSYKEGWLCENGQPVLPLFTDKSKAILSKIRFCSRLLRLEPRCATMVNDNLMLIAFRHQVMIVSLSLKKIVGRLPSRSGFSHPLNFCSLKVYGEPVVYWGDYGDNNSQEAIHVHRIGEDCKDEIVCTFQAGMIKHVHNILYDKWRNRFIILTGDFGENVGIYIANKDFSLVEPYYIGSEKYRAVQALVTANGLIWATDAVIADNYLYYLDFETNEIKRLSSLNGSVIYGMEVNGGLLFSTTVEPYPSSSSKIATLLDYRLGPGIKSRDVHLLFVDKDLQVKEMGRYRKDLWLMRLFQYGQIMFPYYEDKHQNEVYVNPMAVKKFDGKEIIIKLKQV